MKQTIRITLSWALASVVVLVCSAAHAATFFDEDFNTLAGLPGPNLEQALGGSAATFSSSNATFPGGSGADRSYLRTVDDDYNTVDFIAEVTVTVNSTASGIIFFGFGQGDRLSSASQEPRSGSHIFMSGYPDDFAAGRFGLVDNDIDTQYDADHVGTGTHRLRMTWDSTLEQLTLEIHQDYAGGLLFPVLVRGLLMAQTMGLLPPIQESSSALRSARLSTILLFTKYPSPQRSPWHYCHYAQFVTAADKFNFSIPRMIKPSGFFPAAFSMFSIPKETTIVTSDPFSWKSRS